MYQPSSDIDASNFDLIFDNSKSKPRLSLDAALARQEAALLAATGSLCLATPAAECTDHSTATCVSHQGQESAIEQSIGQSMQQWLPRSGKHPRNGGVPCSPAVEPASHIYATESTQQQPMQSNVQQKSAGLARRYSIAVEPHQRSSPKLTASKRHQPYPVIHKSIDHENRPITNHIHAHTKAKWQSPPGTEQILASGVVPVRAATFSQENTAIGDQSSKKCDSCDQLKQEVAQLSSRVVKSEAHIQQLLWLVFALKTQMSRMQAQLCSQTQHYVTTESIGHSDDEQSEHLLHELTQTTEQSPSLHSLASQDTVSSSSTSLPVDSSLSDMELSQDDISMLERFLADNTNAANQSNIKTRMLRPCL